MFAAQLTETNQPLVYAELASPEPGRGEVLIDLKAAALNHRDVYIQKGQYPGVQMPVIPGSDGAGTIAALGEGVTNLSIGQEVVVNPSFGWGSDPRVQSQTYSILGMPRNGTFAQQLVVPALQVFRKPKHLNFNEAAALPLAGLTAWRALMTRAALRKSDRVLITGIGGGVAQFAMLFAVGHGNETWVTSSSAHKLEKAMAAGATGTANYSQEGWADRLQEAAGLFDVIIDSAGGEGFGELTQLVAPGGRIVFYGGTRGKWPRILPQPLFWKQVSILGSTMGTAEEFGEMLKFTEKEQLVPLVDQIFPLQEAQAALNRMDAGDQMGKIVLRIPE